jgi:hypothetical protein
MTTCAGQSGSMQQFVEDRRASGAFKIAAEAELQLWPIEGRRRRTAPEWRNVEHCKNVTRHPEDFFKRLAVALPLG